MSAEVMPVCVCEHSGLAGQCHLPAVLSCSAWTREGPVTSAGTAAPRPGLTAALDLHPRPDITVLGDAAQEAACSGSSAREFCGDERLDLSAQPLEDPGHFPRVDGAARPPSGCGPVHSASSACLAATPAWPARGLQVPKRRTWL